MTKVIGKLSYDPKDKIGLGAFGTVFSGFYSQSTPVAIKQVQIGRVKEEEIKKEVELMIKANAKDHPNILRYIFEEKNDDFMFIATELCRGTLEDYVKGNYDGPKFESEREILWQIAQGLAHLHGLDIVHRDLKPTNILIYVSPSNDERTEAGPNPQVKLADFGRSKIIVNDFTNTSMTNPNGTRGWIAPELYENKRAGPKVDIFALGLIFGYTLSGGKHPFGEDQDKRSVRIKDKQPIAMVLNDLKEPYSENYEAFDLIESMLVMNPDERPTVKEIINSLFLFFPANRQKMFESIRNSIKDDSYAAESIVHFKKLLIDEESIDVNVDFKSGDTLLQILCRNYKDDNLIYLVQLLVKKGADVKAKDIHDGSNLLHSLFLNCYINSNLIDIVQLLIKCGADVKAKGICGWTPLHVLCIFYKNDNLIDIVQLLINNGAEVNAKDDRGKTPLHFLSNSHGYAIKGGDNWKSLVSLFKENGASMDAKDNKGRTPNDELILRKNREATYEALNALKLDKWTQFPV